jgi:hypothetical protein
VVREEVRLGLAFYRAEGEVERTAEAVAWELDRPAINGGGGSVRDGFGEGKRRGGSAWECAAHSRATSGRGGGAGCRGGGAGVREAARPWGRRGGAAGGRGRPRQVGPTCRWLREREREGRRAVWAGSGAGPRLGKRKEGEVRRAGGGIGFVVFFQIPFKSFQTFLLYLFKFKF